MDALFDGLEPIPEEGILPHHANTDKTASDKAEDVFPILARIQDTRPRRLDGGRTVLRPSLPYDNTSRMMSCFLDLYIGARYAPPPSPPRCICHGTVI